jgi:bacterioferritin-associated ferredoxin
MFVCICKAVSQGEVGKAIDAGACSIEAVGQMTGAGTDCGGCHRSITRELLRAGALRTSDPVEACSVAEGAPQPG